MPEDTIQKLVEQHIRNQIDMLESSLYIQPDEDLGETPFESPEQLEENIEWGEKLNNQLKFSFANGDFSWFEGMANKLINNTGTNSIKKGTQEYTKLCGKLLEVDIRAWPLRKKAWQSDFSFREDIPKVFPEIAETIPVTSAQAAPKTSITVKEAIKDFWNEYSENWKPRSVTDYETIVNKISRLLGPETQLHTLDYTKLKSIRDGLRDKLSIKRTNLIMATIQRIYGLACKKDRQLDRMNPAEGLQLKDKKTKASERQDVFSNEDLDLLFSAENYDKHIKKPAKYWLPILGLYTGARLEELCQLLKADVIQHDDSGMWCLDIREDNSEYKSVKTGERRLVPLHPFLIDELKFHDYVHNSQHTANSDRVFPDLTYVKNRWGHGFSQWFGKYRTKVGIEAPPRKKTFHSFRHTAINNLKQQGGEKQYVKELVGHSDGDITWDLYGKQFRPDIIMEKAVSRFNFGIDLSHLKDSKFVPK